MARRRVEKTRTARLDALDAFNKHHYWAECDNIHAAKLELRAACPPVDEGPM